MNRDHLFGIWMQWSGGLKERWGMLAGDAHAVAAGRRDRLAGKIRARRGLAKQEADRQLREFMHNNRKWWDLSSR